MTDRKHLIATIDRMETTRTRDTIDVHGMAQGLPVTDVTAKWTVITCTCGTSVTADTLGHAASAFIDHDRFAKLCEREGVES